RGDRDAGRGAPARPARRPHRARAEPRAERQAGRHHRRQPPARGALCKIGPLMDLRKVLLKVLYWLAVLAVSIAILVGLITLLESRDKSSVSGGVLIMSPAPF